MNLQLWGLGKSAYKCKGMPNIYNLLLEHSTKQFHFFLFSYIIQLLQYWFVYSYVPQIKLSCQVS